LDEGASDCPNWFDRLLGASWSSLLWIGAPLFPKSIFYLFKLPPPKVEGGCDALLFKNPVFYIFSL